MNTIQQLNFLQEKIEEIGSAIFHNLSDAVLKLPDSIITSLKADEYGYVWFFVEKPNESLQEFEKEFPVKLDFYKKGKGYYLQASGKGFVVTDPEEMNSVAILSDEMKRFANSKHALVKVRIQSAQCYQTNSSSKSSWWKNARNTITTWLGQQPYGTGHTYFPAS